MVRRSRCDFFEALPIPIKRLRRSSEALPVPVKRLKRSSEALPVPVKRLTSAGKFLRRSKKCYIDALPVEILENILSRLERREAARACMVSREWKRVGLLVRCRDLDLNFTANKLRAESMLRAVYLEGPFCRKLMCDLQEYAPQLQKLQLTLYMKCKDKRECWGSDDYDITFPNELKRKSN